MSDNDLIRRWDALRIMSDGDGVVGPDYPEWFINRYAAINAIPAVQPTVSPGVAALVEAVEVLLMQHDFENPMRQADYHGDICQCRRCRMDGLRAALARVKSKECFSDEKGVM